MELAILLYINFCADWRNQSSILVSFVKIRLNYWSDGTRMIKGYTYFFVTIFVMLVSSAKNFGSSQRLLSHPWKGLGPS